MSAIPTQKHPANADSPPGVTTEEFARLNLVRSQSVVARLCRTGSYHGVRPTKLASGRLLWPAITVIANGEKAA